MNPDAAWTQLPEDTLADTFRSASVDEVRRRLVAHNPELDHRQLLATPTWDIGNYNSTNTPAIVAVLPDTGRAAFSAQRGDRVQDLCFRMPGQGWKLPTLLRPYLDAIRLSIEAERALNDDFAVRATTANRPPTARCCRRPTRCRWCASPGQYAFAHPGARCSTHPPAACSC